MIVTEKNFVHTCLKELKKITTTCNDKTVYNAYFCNKIVSPDGEIEIHESKKSLVISSHLKLDDLMDLIDNADEDDIRQIMELLMFYLEKAHFLAKLKL